MSWPLFAVIQLSIVTLGVMVAFWLRNRELKRRYEALESASAEAFEAVEQAREQLKLGADKAWIRDRLEVLQGEDEVTVIQRLVLGNELEADGEFQHNLREQLNSGESAQQALQEQWQQIRTTSHELASRLIESYPLSHPVISQLYDAFGELDATLAVQLPDLPEAPDTSELDSTDASQEAENLRASNELLQQELDRFKEELASRDASSGDAEEQAEDLKGLLQQFTKDSRDMMECIQKLEAENKVLRDKLGLGPDGELEVSPTVADDAQTSTLDESVPAAAEPQAQAPAEDAETAA